MRELLAQLFPRLLTTTFEVTSAADARYNCVAWAAGDTRRWWWPGEPPFSFWPAGVKREETIASFIEAFATLGYEPASTGFKEDGFEKVVIFASSDGVPTHMARQLSDGAWTSKLGRLEDISHVDAAAVGGTDYGEIGAFLRRPETSST